jgi:hypothetical protein
MKQNQVYSNTNSITLKILESIFIINFYEELTSSQIFVRCSAQDTRKEGKVK